MHPGGMRSAMDLFDFEKSANLKHPSDYASHLRIQPGKYTLKESHTNATGR